MSKENWDDKNFVLEQVQKNSYALQYASARLQDDDEEVVLTAVKRDGKALIYKNSSKYFMDEAKELFSGHKNNLASVESAYTASQPSIQKPITVSNLTELIAQFKTIKADCSGQIKVCFSHFLLNKA
jgi:hypothetical protein